jgi:hypothetical protein
MRLAGKMRCEIERVWAGKCAVCVVCFAVRLTRGEGSDENRVFGRILSELGRVFEVEKMKYVTNKEGNVVGLRDWRLVQRRASILHSQPQPQLWLPVT